MYFKNLPFVNFKNHKALPVKTKDNERKRREENKNFLNMFLFQH